MFQSLWNMTKLSSKLQVPWFHKGMSNKQNESEKMEQLKNLYASVAPEILNKIYKKYRLDYKIFGYSFHKSVLNLLK